MFAGAGFALGSRSFAQATWEGAGANDLYTTAGNWSPAVAPNNTGTQTIDLDVGAAGQTIGVNTGANVAGIVTTGSGTGFYSLQQVGGGTLTIGSGGIDNSGEFSSYLAIDVPAILSASQTWNGDAGYIVAYNTVGGTGTLTTIGSIYLFSPNSFSGGLVITSGSNVAVQNSGAGTGAVTLMDGAGFAAYFDSVTMGNAFTLEGSVSLGADGTTTTLTVNGPVALADSTTVVQVNDTLYLNGTITGTAGSALEFTGSGAMLPVDGGSQTVISGPLAGVQTLSVSGVQLVLSPTSGTPNADFSSVGASGMVVQNMGYLGLGGTFSNAGAVTTFLSTYGTGLGTSIDGTLGFDTPISASSPSVFNDPVNLSGFSSEGFLGLGSSSTAILSLTAVITPFGTQYEFGGGGGVLTVQSPLADNEESTSLEMTNAPGQLKLLLQGGATYTGGTYSRGGALIFDSAAPMVGSITLNGGYVGYTEMATNITSAGLFVGMFDTDGSNSGVVGFDSTNPLAPRTISDLIDMGGFSGGIFLGTATAVTLSGTINPSEETNAYQFTGVLGGQLTISSSLTNTSASAVIGLVTPIEANGSNSVVTLTGTNTYQGGTTFNSGTLFVNNNSSLGTGTLFVPNTSNAPINAPYLAPFGADVTLPMNIQVSSFEGGSEPGLTLGNVSTGDMLTIGGVISDGETAGTIGINGPVTYTQPNTYSGGTYIVGNGNAALYLTPTATLGSGPVTVQETGSIIPTGGDVTVSNPIALEDTLTLGASGNPNKLTLTGVISGGNGLNIESNVELDGANTFDGETLVENAILTLGNAEALGTGPLTESNASVQYMFPNPEILDLSGDGSSAVMLESESTLTLNTPNATDYFEFDGLISGDSSNQVTKIGLGTEVLGGSSSYAGGTNISGGTLVATNPQAFGLGPVLVSAGANLGVGSGTTLTNTLNVTDGATLSGAGTFSPASGIVVQNGTTVVPNQISGGNLLATLTFGTPLTFAPGGIYDFNVATASGVAGTDYSTINVTAAFTVTATSGSPFTIMLGSAVPESGVAGMAAFDPTMSYSWTILSATSITGFSPADFLINTSAFQNSLGTGNLTLAQVGNTLTLDFTPVPEPSTWGLLLGGTLLVGFIARRRGRAS